LQVGANLALSADVTHKIVSEDEGASEALIVNGVHRVKVNNAPESLANVASINTCAQVSPLTITLVAGWHLDALLACQRPTACSKPVPLGTATYAFVHVLLTSPLGRQIYQLLSSETTVVLSAH
jgi:hypothetical protein